MRHKNANLLLFCYPLLVIGGFFFCKSVFYAIVYIICGKILLTVGSYGKKEKQGIEALPYC